MSNEPDQDNVSVQYVCSTSGCGGIAELKGGICDKCKETMYPKAKTFEQRLAEMRGWGLNVDRREEESDEFVRQVDKLIVHRQFVQ